MEFNIRCYFNFIALLGDLDFFVFCQNYVSLRMIEGVFLVDYVLCGYII